MAEDFDFLQFTGDVAQGVNVATNAFDFIFNDLLGIGPRAQEEKKQKRQRAKLGRLTAEALERDAGRILEVGETKAADLLGQAEERAGDYERLGRWRVSDLQRDLGWRTTGLNRGAARRIEDITRTSGRQIADVSRETGRFVTDTRRAFRRTSGDLTRRTEQSRAGAALAYARSGVMLTGSATQRLGQVESEGAEQQRRLGVDTRTAISRAQADAARTIGRTRSDRGMMIGRTSTDRDVALGRAQELTGTAIGREQFLSGENARRTRHWADVSATRIREEAGYQASRITHPRYGKAALTRLASGASEKTMLQGVTEALQKQNPGWSEEQAGVAAIVKITRSRGAAGRFAF